MKLCIVGGTGYLGKHLCQALHSRNIPTVTTSRAPDQEFLRKFAPSVRAVAVDDPLLLQELASSTALIYLGSSSRPGISWRSPTHEIESNLGATARIVRQALDANPSCHIIFASSGGTIYGPGHTCPISESTAEAPATAYGLGKLLAEKTLEFYTRTGRHGVTVLRIANPVGRWQAGSRHGFVSAVVQSALSSKAVTIYGDGQNIRDYIDADELAHLFLQVAETSFGGFRIYNVGSGTGLSEIEVLKSAEEILGRKVAFDVAPARPFDLKYAVLDPTRIIDEFGWRAALDINSIITKLSTEIRDLSA
jgi:UDP-glucose 4-epimerase